ncbi:DUF1236 domain-containing protein [Microbacteriaceae bacterium K1510]|nr:DUF1236 domain-containing protein [Microbacteriaceae bacterium K1510]
MKARLLSTVAASLLIGVGIASAQSPNQQSAPEKAPAAQQKAPAEKMAPPMNASEHKGSETTGQATPDNKMDRDRSGTMNRSEPKAAPNTQGQRGATENKSDMNRSATDTNRTQGSTTGQGAASGQAKLSTEQRTKITTVIRGEKVERVEPSQLNVAINVGTRIPGTVHVHRLPQEVVTIYPEWRGYDYILVGEQIVIIDPRTHEIVFILEA